MHHLTLPARETVPCPLPRGDADGRSRRVRSIAAWALGVCVVLAFFHAPLGGGRQFYHSDSHALLYPLKELMASELRSGRLPVWDPHSLCGYPVIGCYVSAAFLPQNLLFLALPFGLAFAAFVVLKHVLAASFQYLLLRGFGLPRTAAAPGAVLFALSGPLLSISDFHAFAFECFPLMLWCWWRVVEPMVTEGSSARIRGFAASWRERGWIVAALAFAFAFLHGDLQTVLAGGLLVLFLPLAVAGPEALTLRRAWPRWLLLVLATGCLGAVQLLPSAALVGESTRLDLPESERLLHSLSWSGMGELIWPSPTASGKSTDFIAFKYLGLAALALAAAGVALSRGRGPRRLALYFLAVALGALLLSLGESAPIVGPLLAGLPGFSLFRYPQKWLGLLAFAVSVLAALGIGELHRRGFRRGAAAVGVLAVLELFASASPFLAVRTVDASAFRPENLLAIGDHVPGFSPHDRILRLPTNGAFSGLLVRPPSAGTDAPDVEDGIRTRMIAWNVQTLLGNNASRAGVRRVSGLSSFNFRRTETLWREAARRGRIARLADLTSARWILTTPQDARSFLGREGLEGLFPVATPAASWPTGLGHVELYERPTALPRAFVVERLRRARSDEEALEALFDPALDPRSCAVMVGDVDARLPDGSGASGIPEGDVPRRCQVEFIRDACASIEIEVSGAGPRGGVLVLNDSYDEGWRATVNGEPAKILRANHFARAVVVPPGSSRVTMTYAPVSIRLGGVVSILTLGLLIAGLLFGGRSPRGRP